MLSLGRGWCFCAETFEISPRDSSLWEYSATRILSEVTSLFVSLAIFLNRASMIEELINMANTKINAVAINAR